jgi:hypothetical protein
VDRKTTNIETEENHFGKQGVVSRCVIENNTNYWVYTSKNVFEGYSIFTCDNPLCCTKSIEELRIVNYN